MSMATMTAIVLAMAIEMVTSMATVTAIVTTMAMAVERTQWDKMLL